MPMPLRLWICRCGQSPTYGGSESWCTHRDHVAHVDGEGACAGEHECIAAVGAMGCTRLSVLLRDPHPQSRDDPFVPDQLFVDRLHAHGPTKLVRKECGTHQRVSRVGDPSPPPTAYASTNHAVDQDGENRDLIGGGRDGREGTAGARAWGSRAFVQRTSIPEGPGGPP